ncbi:MAG: glutamate synthase subunit alpha, partial [Terriglobales bacterium]
MPPRQGLYDPAHEHDACGMGFVASIRRQQSHQIIEQGIQVLVNLTHRGACGCDPETGDGAGVLIQIPHKFFVRECATLGFDLPAPAEYAVGMTFLPVEKHPRLNCEGVLERIIREEGLSVLGWRYTPVNGDAIGRVARASQPYLQHIFVGRPAEIDEEAFERKLYA